MTALEAACVLAALLHAAIRFCCDVKPWRCLSRLAALVVMAWLADDLAIRLYGLHAYAPGAWGVFIDRVPLGAAMLWGAMLESAWVLGRHIAGHESRYVPLAAAVVILADAALVQPLGVAAGLWRWEAPGLLGVPLAAFAASAASGGVAIAMHENIRRRGRYAYWDPLTIPAGVLAGHLAALAGWWALPPRTLGPIPQWPTLAGLAVVAVLLVVAASRAQRRMGLRPLLERIPAAMLAAGLLAAHGGHKPALLACSLVVVTPWLVVVPWRALELRVARS